MTNRGRDDLLDADRGDVKFRHIRRKIRVAFIRTHHEGTGLGDHKVGACHTGIRGEYQRTRCLTLRFGEIVDIAVRRIRPDGLGEDLGDVGPKRGLTPPENERGEEPIYLDAPKRAVSLTLS